MISSIELRWRFDCVHHNQNRDLLVGGSGGSGVLGRSAGEVGDGDGRQDNAAVTALLLLGSGGDGGSRGGAVHRVVEGELATVAVDAGVLGDDGANTDADDGRDLGHVGGARGCVLVLALLDRRGGGQGQEGEGGGDSELHFDGGSLVSEFGREEREVEEMLLL